MLCKRIASAIIFCFCFMSSFAYAAESGIVSRKASKIGNYSGDGTLSGDMQAIVATVAEWSMYILFAMGIVWAIMASCSWVAYQNNPSSKQAKSGWKVIAIYFVCAMAWNFYPFIDTMTKSFLGVSACGYTGMDKTGTETLAGKGCWDESGSEILNNSAEVKRIKEVMGDEFEDLRIAIRRGLNFIALLGLIFAVVWVVRIKKMVDDDSHSKQYTGFDAFLGLAASTLLINGPYVIESLYSFFSKYFV